MGEMFKKGGKVEHYGSGSRDVAGFANAWDLFNDYQHSSDFIGLRLIKLTQMEIKVYMLLKKPYFICKMLG